MCLDNKCNMVDCRPMELWDWTTEKTSVNHLKMTRMWRFYGPGCVSGRRSCFLSLWWAMVGERKKGRKSKERMFLVDYTKHSNNSLITERHKPTEKHDYEYGKMAHESLCTVIKSHSLWHKKQCWRYTMSSLQNYCYYYLISAPQIITLSAIMRVYRCANDQHKKY